MNVITLRDYAKQNNISYEAVRKQVVRYADELGDHIIKDGRQQFLDEEAVAFLDAKRQKNPVAIIQMDKDEQLEALRNDKEALLIKLASVQDELLREKNKVQALIDEQKGQIALLEADNEAQRVKVAETEKKASEDVQRAQKELSEAKKQFEDKEYLLQQEIEQLRNRKWWQLLFKK